MGATLLQALGMLETLPLPSSFFLFSPLSSNNLRKRDTKKNRKAIAGKDTKGAVDDTASTATGASSSLAAEGERHSFQSYEQKGKDTDGLASDEVDEDLYRFTPTLQIWLAVITLLQVCSMYILLYMSTLLSLYIPFLLYLFIYL